MSITSDSFKWSSSRAETQGNPWWFLLQSCLRGKRHISLVSRVPASLAFRLRCPQFSPLRSWLPPVSSRCPSLCPFLCVMLPGVSWLPRVITVFLQNFLFHPWALLLSGKIREGAESHLLKGLPVANLGEASFLISNFLVYIKKQTNKILWCPVSSLVFPRQEETFKKNSLPKRRTVWEMIKTTWSHVVNQTEPNKIYLWLFIQNVRDILKMYRQVHRKRNNNKMLIEVISRWEENGQFNPLNFIYDLLTFITIKWTRYNHFTKYSQKHKFINFSVKRRFKLKRISYLKKDLFLKCRWAQIIILWSNLCLQDGP